MAGSPHRASGARTPPPTARQKRLTLVAAILGSSIVFIDSTVVNVALPAIRADLGAGLAEQQWVVEAYLLTLGSLLLIGGSLSDLLGRRRVFAAGTALFGLTSLLVAVAPSAGFLIGARALQGVAGAILVPGTLALIVAVFDEHERGRAIGTWTAWTGASTVIGPLAGGALIELASWRWVFALGLVPVTATLVLIPRAIPVWVDRRSGPVRVDWTGALLCALGLAGPVFALIQEPGRGFGDPAVLVPLVAGIALLAAFVAHEARTPAPMLPLSLFRRRNFAVGNTATFGVYAGLGAATFLLPVFLQQIAGYTALEAGMVLLPVTVIMFTLSGRFGALADRIGPRLLMSAGPLIAAGGLLLLSRMDGQVSYAEDLLPGVAAFGLGLAMTVAPLTATVLGDADPEHVGVSSGANNAIARVASLVAIALVGAAISAQFATRLAEGVRDAGLGPRARVAVAAAKDRPLTATPPGSVDAADRDGLAGALRTASVDAFSLGMGIAAALVAAGGLVSAAGIRNPRRETAAAECPGGAICGVSEEVAHAPAGFTAPEAEPARA
jgi:EmrB/QacA subfamily drug resistance transporter